MGMDDWVSITEAFAQAMGKSVERPDILLPNTLLYLSVKNSLSSVSDHIMWVWGSKCHMLRRPSSIHVRNSLTGVVNRSFVSKWTIMVWGAGSLM